MQSHVPDSFPPGAAAKSARRVTTTQRFPRRTAIFSEATEDRRQAISLPSAVEVELKLIPKSEDVAAQLLLAFRAHPLFEMLEQQLVTI